MISGTLLMMMVLGALLYWRETDPITSIGFSRQTNGAGQTVQRFLIYLFWYG